MIVSLLFRRTFKSQNLMLHTYINTFIRSSFYKIQCMCTSFTASTHDKFPPLNAAVVWDDAMNKWQHSKST